MVPASSGTARQLTDGEWNVGAQFDGLFSGAGLDWSPDSERIYFDGWNEPDGDSVYRRSHIYAIDVGTEEITQLTEEIGFWTSPTVSPNGNTVAYAGYPATEVTYEMPRVYAMDADGGNARLLSEDFDQPPANIITARTWLDHQRAQ